MFSKFFLKNSLAAFSRNRSAARVVKKGIAFFTAASLSFPVPLARALPVPDAAESLKPFVSPLHLSVPEKIGDIKEKFEGKDSRTVIIIQDAHAIPAAQRSIHQLIEFFVQDYQVPVVALEGAASPLDPLIFKTFPDRALLRKVFENYFDAGELAGGTAAAIFSSSPAVYEGVEDWTLYEEGLEYFLASMGNEKESGLLLRSMLEELKSEKEQGYSKTLLDVDKTMEAFHHNEVDLIAMIRKLSAVKAPEKGSELALLAEEAGRPGEPDAEFEGEVKKISGVIREALEHDISEAAQQDLRLFHEKWQDFQTSKVQAEELALFLKELSIKHHIRVRVSAKLNSRVGHQKKLRDIEGTRLFDDLEKYEQFVKEALFQNPEERELDLRSRRLTLLEKLEKLELSRKDWGEIKSILVKIDYWNVRQEGVAGEDKLLSGLKTNIDFYRNSEKRDQMLHEKALKLMEKNKARSAVLVAGGFHAEGLTRLFQSEGVSYALVMPKIQEMPEENNYRRHMQGEVSWGDYFQVQDGKVNLYNAFVRGTRDALVKLSAEDQGRILKSWRDEMIRNLAAQNRIGESGSYTKFIDEVHAPHPDSQGLAGQWKKNVDRFIEKFRGFQSQGQMSEQAFAGLLQSSLVPAGPTAAPIARSELRVDLIPGLKEMRPEGAVRRTLPEKVSSVHRSELRSGAEKTLDFKDLEKSIREKGWAGEELLAAIHEKQKILTRMSSEFGLPEAGDAYEGLEDNARLVTHRLWMSWHEKNMTYLASARGMAEQGAITPISFIYDLTQEFIYFNEQGKSTNLLGWLEGYYAPLKTKGVQLEISTISAREAGRMLPVMMARNEKVRSLIENHPYESVPMLEIRYQGQVKKVPFLLTYDVQGETPLSSGSYKFFDEGISTSEDHIQLKSFLPYLVGPEAGRPEGTFLRSLATLVHEIDHAVMIFLQETDVRAKQRNLNVLKEQVKQLEAAPLAQPFLAFLLSQINLTEAELNKQKSLQSIAHALGYEGSAQGAEFAFLEQQIRGVSRQMGRSQEEENALTVLIDHDRFNKQLLPDSVLYAMGDILYREVSERVPMEDIYFTGKLDEAISGNRSRVGALLAYFTTGVKGWRGAYDKLAAEPLAELSYEKIIRKHQNSLEVNKNDSYYPFVLGERAFTVIAEVQEQIASMSEDAVTEAVEHELREHSESYPEARRESLRASLEERKSFLMNLRILDMWKSESRKTLESFSGSLEDFEAAPRSELRSEVAHVEGLKVPGGGEGIWIGQTDLSDPVKMETYKRSVTSSQAVQEHRGVQFIVDRGRFTAAEAAAIESTVREILKNLSAAETARLIQHQQARGKGLAPIVITKLDESISLFEDHKANGFAGIHQNLFKPGLVESTVQKILTIGLEHEIKHEALTEERAALVRRTGKSESEINALSADEIKAQMTADLERVVEGELFESGIDKASAIGLSYSDLQPLLAAGVLASVDGFAEALRFHGDEKLRSRHRDFIRQYDQKNHLIDRSDAEFHEVYEAVREILDPLLRAAGLDPGFYRLYLTDEADANAFYLRGSNAFVVNVGLLRLASKNGEIAMSRDAIAFILGHELQHLRQYRADVLSGKADSNMELKVDWKYMSDSRKQEYLDEYDADWNAVDLMSRAGFNVREAPAVFRALLELIKSSEGKAIYLPFGDHPNLEPRTLELENLVLKRYWPNASKPVSKFPDDLKVPVSRFRDFQNRVYAIRSDEEFAQLISEARDIRELAVVISVGKAWRSRDDYRHDPARMTPESRDLSILTEALKKLEELSREIKASPDETEFQRIESEITHLVKGLSIPAGILSDIKTGNATQQIEFTSDGSGVSSMGVSLPWKSFDSVYFLSGPSAGKIVRLKDGRVVMIMTGEVINSTADIFDFGTRQVSRVSTREFFNSQTVSLKIDRATLTRPELPNEALERRVSELARKDPAKALQFEFYKEVFRKRLDHSGRFSERAIKISNDWDFFTGRKKEKREAVADPAEFDAFVQGESVESLLNALENIIPVWIELEEYPDSVYRIYSGFKAELEGGFGSNVEYSKGDYLELMAAAAREIEKRLLAGAVPLETVPRLIAAIQKNKTPSSMYQGIGEIKLKLFSAFMTKLLAGQTQLDRPSALALMDLLNELDFLKDSRSYFGDKNDEAAAMQDQIAKLLYEFYRDPGIHDEVRDLFQKQVKNSSPVKDKFYGLLLADNTISLDQKLMIMEELGRDSRGLFNFKHVLMQAAEGEGSAFVDLVVAEIVSKKPELAALQNGSTALKRFAALIYAGAASRSGDSVFLIFDTASRTVKLSVDDLGVLAQFLRSDLNFPSEYWSPKGLVDLNREKQLALFVDLMRFLKSKGQEQAVFRILLDLDASDALGGYTQKMNYFYGGIANHDLLPEGLQQQKDMRTFSMFFGELMARDADNDMADLFSRFGRSTSRAPEEEGYSVKDMTGRLAATRPQRFGRWDLMQDGDKDPLDYFSFLDAVYSGRSFEESLEELVRQFPESRLRDMLVYTLFIKKIVAGKLGIAVDSSRLFDFAWLRARIQESGVPVHNEIQALLPFLGWDRDIQKMNGKFLAEVDSAALQVDGAVYEQERSGYEDLRFYDIGGSDSQLGLAVASFDQSYFAAALKEENSLEKKLALVLGYYPAGSAFRDRYIQQILEETLKKLKDEGTRLGAALETQIQKALAAFQNVSLRERTAVQFLEVSLERIKASAGKVSMAEEKAEILKYLPGFSYTRDEVLNQFVNRHIKTSRQYKEISPLFVQNPETIRESQSADHLFWKDQVRDVLMNFSASTKTGFLLWLMGMGEKPEEVMREEFRLHVSFDGLRQSFGLHQGAFYSGIGKRDQQDFFNSLFLGGNGIFANESSYQQFLEEIVSDLIPAGRQGLRDIFKAILSTQDLARRQRILMGLLQEFGQLRGIANAEEKEAKSVRVFLQANGLIGVKLGQFLAHSALVKPGSYLQKELQELNDAAEPIDKGILFDMLEKIYNGRAFEDHFESLDELLGSASVKVVHKVTRKDGTQAVIKFKRPEVDKQIAQDLAFLEDILQRFAPALAQEGIPVPAGLVKRLKEILDEELNFGDLEDIGVGEANNQRQMRQNIEPRKTRERAGVIYEFSVPVSTEVFENSVMVESFAGGIALKKEAALRAEGIDPDAIKELLMEELLQQFFFDGFYHADLHSGNMLIQKSGEKVRIHIIDLGAAAKISSDNREALVGILMALWDENNWEANKGTLERLLPQVFASPSMAADLDAIVQSDKNPIQKLMHLFALLEKNNIEFQESYREFYSVIRFLKASEYLFSDAMLEKMKERFLPSDLESVKAKAMVLTAEVKREFEHVEVPVVAATADEGLKVTVTQETMRQTYEALVKIKGMPFWPMVSTPFPQVEQLVDLLLGGLQRLLQRGQSFEAVISKEEMPFYEDLKSDVNLLTGLIRQGSVGPMSLMQALAAVKRIALQRNRIVDFLLKQNLPLDEIFESIRQVAGQSAADRIKALFDSRATRNELRENNRQNTQTSIEEAAEAVINALNPETGSAPNRSELRRIYQGAASNPEEFIRTLERAGLEVTQTQNRPGVETGASEELSRAAMAQSRRLMAWFESRKAPEGEMTLALQLTNAQAHDSFLTQLLKIFAQQGRSVRLFTDKQSQAYVIKQIGRQGLKGLVSSTPLRGQDLTSGIKEVYKSDQPDVPLAFFEGAAAESMDRSFVGLTLNNGAQSLNQDVLFHNELLLAVILTLMPEVIKSGDYRKAVEEGINLLPEHDRENPEKVRQVKAEYLKAALVQRLGELGYPANIFSPQSMQFLTLDGGLMASLLLDIESRQAVGKSA